MKSNWPSFMQKVFEQVKWSTEAYQWNVEGDISSLGTAVTKDVRGMCDRIAKHLDRIRRGLLDSGESPSSQ